MANSLLHAVKTAIKTVRRLGSNATVRPRLDGYNFTSRHTQGSAEKLLNDITNFGMKEKVL